MVRVDEPGHCDAAVVTGSKIVPSRMNTLGAEYSLILAGL